MINEWLEQFGREQLEKIDTYEWIEYPIYILSKGRPRKVTAQCLDDVGVPYYVVVEPDEYDQYKEVYNKGSLLLKLPKKNQGISYVRNFIKEHSKECGWDYHWQLDDNIRDFRIRKNNKNVKQSPLNLLSASENFVKPFNNIGILGLCHVAFAFARNHYVDINKQVYSCVLVNNNVDVQWRPDVVEDTDYSLQVLDAEYCTLLLNKFLIGKETTSKNSGGNENTDEFRMKRSLGLQKHWPGAFKITEQYGRVKVLPSRIWQKFVHLPKGNDLDLNGESLDRFFN